LVKQSLFLSNTALTRQFWIKFRVGKNLI